MRVIALGLLISSTILIFSGCGKCPEPKVEYVNVPQKCVVPSVEKPIIDNTHYESYSDIVAKAMKNYTLMKEYAEKLETASGVCK